MERYLLNHRVIRLPDRLASLVEDAVREFRAEEGPWAVWPRVQGRALWVCPLALPFLIERAFAHLPSEWDRRWLHQQSRRFLLAHLARCESGRERRSVSVALSNLG